MEKPKSLSGIKDLEISFDNDKNPLTKDNSTNILNLEQEQAVYMKRIMNDSNSSIVFLSENKKLKDDKLIDISEEVDKAKIDVLLKNPDKNSKAIEQEFKNLQQNYSKLKDNYEVLNLKFEESKKQRHEEIRNFTLKMTKRLDELENDFKSVKDKEKIAVEKIQTLTHDLEIQKLELIKERNIASVLKDSQKKDKACQNNSISLIKNLLNQKELLQASLEQAKAKLENLSIEKIDEKLQSKMDSLEVMLEKDNSKKSDKLEAKSRNSKKKSGEKKT